MVIRRLAVVALVVLALLVVLVVQHRSDDVAQLAVAPDAASPRAQASSTHEPAPSAANSDAAAQRAHVPELNHGAALPTSTPTLLVRVVDCERFAPVVGAEVRWADWDWIARGSPRTSVSSVRQGERVLESGQVGTSDEQGQIRIATATSLLLVQASHAGLWGQVFVPAGSTEPQELVLAPDGDLLVEVVDPDGAPVAGVRVGARRAGDVQVLTSVNADTGVDGVARLPHARARLVGGAASGTLLVSVLTADPSAPRALVDASPWPAAPIQLHMNATGTVVVNVVGPGGEPVLEPAEVALTATALSRESAHMTEIAVGGVATFEHIPLGAELLISAFPRADANMHSEGVMAAGPRTSGERVVISAPIWVPTTTLVGRALDANGAALANVELQLSVRDAPHSTRYEAFVSTRTDLEGRFEVKLFDALEPETLTPVVVARTSELGLEGFVGFPMAAGGVASRLHLGDIRLLRAPTLASGRVIDEAGAPIAGAQLTLLRRARETESDESAVDEFAVDEFAAQSGVEWEIDVQRGGRSDAQGRFELRALDPSGKYAVRASATGFLVGKQVPFELGASEVELVLTRETQPLRGRVLTSSRESLARLTIRAGQNFGTLDEYGRITIPRRSAEPLDVVLSAEGLGPEPLVTIPNVSAPDDARLAAIDVRSLVHEICFNVVGANDLPVRSVEVSGRARNGASWRVTATGRVCLLSREAALDVSLSCDGYAPASFRGVRTGAVLALERRPLLVLKVPEFLPAGEEITYVVRATRADAERAEIAVSGRETRERLAGPGVWTVRWTVRGSDRVLQQNDIVVGDDDVECRLEAKLADVEAARAESQARAKKSLK